MDVDEDRQLLLARLRGSLSEDIRAEVDERLLHDDEFAEEYIRLAEEEAALIRWSRARLLAAKDAGTPTAERRRGRRALLRRIATWPAVAVTATVVALLLAVMLWPRPNDMTVAPRPNDIIGRVSRMIDVVGVGATLEGHRPSIEAGHKFELERGIVEVTLDNGIRLVLQGPARFEATSLRSGELHHGVVAADVPPAENGYTVQTPRAAVIDLGTKFAVSVDESGQTEIEVFEGEVQTVVGSGASGGEDGLRIAEGAAFQLDADAARPGEVAADRPRFREVKVALYQQTVLASQDHYVRGGKFVDSVTTDPGPNGSLVVKSDRCNLRIAVEACRQTGYFRKCWIRFDLAECNFDVEAPAELSFRTIDTLNSGGAPSIVNVYALKSGFSATPEQLGVDWQEDELTWNSAPGNDVSNAILMTDQADLLGQIHVEQPSQNTVTEHRIALSRLGDYLQADDSLTVMLSVAWQKHKGAILYIASSESEDVPGPELTFNLKAG